MNPKVYVVVEAAVSPTSCYGVYPTLDAIRKEFIGDLTPAQPGQWVGGWPHYPAWVIEELGTGTSGGGIMLFVHEQELQLPLGWEHHGELVEKILAGDTMTLDLLRDVMDRGG